MATIKDVARLAGVGLGTASRAISGRGPVSEKTLAKVNEAVAQLNFRPSSMARALSSKTLGMIGVYVPDFCGTFYGPILQRIDNELRAAGHHMVATNGCGHGDARQQALDGVRFLYERECDGVMVMSNHLSDDDVAEMLVRHPKLAVLNRSVAARPSSCFSSDHALGGRLAARALLAKGHRQIACIAGPEAAADNQARMHGFFDELATQGVKVPPHRRLAADFSFDGGYAAAQALLTQPARDYSALFCANDVMAMAAISCMVKLGIDVPGELSVLGFDDSELSHYTAPKLTTVRVPIVDAAAAACRFLLNACYGLDLSVAREFPPEIIWRDSVADRAFPTVTDLT